MGTLRLALIVTAAALVACSVDLSVGSSPIRGGEVSRFDHGALIQRLPLTPEQCHAVSTWLDLHRPGWSSSPVTFAPAVLVSLRHEDSTTTTLDVFPTFVVVAHEGSQFTRNVSAKDTTELKRLLGLPSDG